VPLFTLVLLLLGNFVDQARLLTIVQDYLAMMLPAQAGAIADEIATFLDHREVFGWVVVGTMLFFSSLAFSVLEKAMEGIFHHRPQASRSLLTRLLLPYLHVLLVAVGLLAVTGISGALEAVEGTQLALGGWTLRLTGITAGGLYACGVAGQTLLLTSIYMVLPAARISFRHALIGGVAAGVAWEILRHLLVWYFTTLSMVGVIYGSLATAVVALLSLEVAGAVLLLGAQVIAEFERAERELRGATG
jgi:membrane protein